MPTVLDRLRQLASHVDVMTPSAELDSSQADQPTNLGFKLGNFAIDDYRPMKIIVIGAGMSGILAGIRFRQYIQNLTLTIYEKESNIGGTWYVNKYPGVACDVPAHCYQYSFENKTDWSALYSPGAEILEHLESIVAKYKLAPYMKLQHELVEARYDEQSAKWHVRVKRPSSTTPGAFEEFEDEADFLFMGVGILSRWNWPEVEGLHDFKGTLVHSANWNLGGVTWEEDVKAWGDKNVAVIGLGSSALQIASALQGRVGRLTQYARGKTWVSPPFLQDKISEFLSRSVEGDENYTYTEEEIKSFEDLGRFAEFRRALDNEMNTGYQITENGSRVQMNARRDFQAHMNSALEARPDIAERLIPDFPVSCRRLTPAPGYLRGLATGKIDLVNGEIKRVTADGVEHEGGEFRKQDIIICATGFDVSYRFPFAIYGRGGVNLQDKWTPHPESYLSVCTDGFPNCFFACGPNSCTAAGTLMPMIEHQVGYAVHVARKMQRERLKSIEVKREAVEDFDAYIETVFTENVRTWYKMGKAQGRIVGLWPGSPLHCVRALQHPRWEDFAYERADATSRNKLCWLGNGMTQNELTLKGNRAWFLDDDYVDVPPVPA
ncbi:hypothetical protein EIP86_006177 [Pleurotus ostreatoroseus]|nr:hypothetical protein EIP86_006177 [Pleurotus ostreatoroseus]